MSIKIKKHRYVIGIFFGIVSLPVIALLLKYCFYYGLLLGKFLRFL